MTLIRESVHKESHDDLNDCSINFALSTLRQAFAVLCPNLATHPTIPYRHLRHYGDLQHVDNSQQGHTSGMALTSWEDI